MALEGRFVSGKSMMLPEVIGVDRNAEHFALDLGIFGTTTSFFQVPLP